MSLIFSAVHAYARFFGGDSGPSGLSEARYVLQRFRSGHRVVDVGGGEGKLANRIAAHCSLAIVLDREQTLLDGADNSIYEGSLSRLLRTRKNGRVVPVRADATEFPLCAGSVDLIVSCQLLEHIDSAAKRLFFAECARCLRPGGALAISTPCADFMDGHEFQLSRFARRMLSPATVSRLPASLRGPWLEQSVEEWEAKVGHFGHGCYDAELREAASCAGLHLIDRRATHTRVTSFWLELMFVFPLLGMLATPLTRLLYEIEARLPPAPGINLLMTFGKPGLLPASARLNTV